MFVWFVHCAFFSESLKEVLQPIVFVYGHPLISAMWQMIVIYILGILCNQIYRKILLILPKMK